MKKAFFTLAILVMAFGNASFAQRKANLKSDAIQNVLKHYGLRDATDLVPQTATWQSALGVSYHTTYSYDEYDFYLVEELTEVDFGNGWRPAEQVTYEYDFAGNVLEIVVAEYEEGEWEEVQISTYTYDGEALSEIVHQYWDGSAWQNDMKEVYNFNGDVTTVLFWEWNGTTWSSRELHTYTFGQNSVEVLMQYMQGGAWQNEEKDTYTLDFIGNVTEILKQTWVGTSWTNDELTTYDYAGGVFNTKTVKRWNGTSWLADKRFEYEYDDNGNAIHGECFEVLIDQWYPGDGDIEMAYGYNAATKEYYGAIVDMVYVDLTGVNENPAAMNLSVYPQPAQNEVNIKADGFAKAEIYNLAGQKLMESESATLNVGNLATGLYIIKVYDCNGNLASQKLTVK